MQATDAVWRREEGILGDLLAAIIPAQVRYSLDAETPGELVARCAQGEELELADALDLAALDPRALDGAARVELIQAFERVAAMVAGLQQEALAAVVDATTAGGLDGEAARHEVGTALRLAPVTAAERTRVAANLRARHPHTLAALKTGAISYRQAGALAEAVRDLPDELAGAVEAAVLPKMPAQTAAETRRAVRDAIVRLDPQGAEARRRTAVRERTIERMPQPDGMAAWFVALPVDAEHDLWTALSARARALRAARTAAGLDREPLTALRVDALTDLVLGRAGWLPPQHQGAHPGTERRHQAGPSGACGHHDSVDEPESDPDDGTAGGGGIDPELAALVLAILHGTATVATTNGTGGAAALAGPGRPGYVPRCSCGGRQVAAVVLDLPTALGLADNPGHLTGYGTIPAPLARRMAMDRDWIRWTRDPGTRTIIDRGAHSYRPSQRLKAFIAARDHTCGFPGCNTPAQACDCDHIATYRLGGRTVTINLGPLCRQHHNAKTHGRWQLTYDPVTNTKTWTSPLGKTYLKNPTPLLL